MKIFKFIVCFVFSFLFTLVFDSVSVSAVEYTYESGKVAKKYKDVVVNSFSYDYITKIDQGEIIVNGFDLSKETFYSGRSISLNYNH